MILIMPDTLVLLARIIVQVSASKVSATYDCHDTPATGLFTGLARCRF
jgi:hypothetical protein